MRLNSYKFRAYEFYLSAEICVNLRPIEFNYFATSSDLEIHMFNIVPLVCPAWSSLP